MRIERLFLLLIALTWGGVWAAPPIITLDGAGSGRMFEGQGAMSAGGSSRLLIDYPEPYRSQILDYLFKPNYGAGFQALKVELGGDMNSTAGSEPSHMHSRTDQNYQRGYEFWLMEQAKLRNPNITLSVLSWGAPGWLGNGQFFSQDTIDYIINYIRGAKAYHNLTIDYVGILNERPHNVYWIIQLKAGLRSAGLTTKIVAADQSGYTIVQDMLANPALMDAVDAVGFHYPRFDGGLIPVNKPLWATEDGQAWTWNGNWPGAAYLAKAYNRPYINSRITKHEVWSLVTSYYDILLFPGSGQMYANTPWSGNYTVLPAIWATAHTNQFAGPGWQYVDNSSGFVGAGSYVTLKKGSDFSIVIENVDGGDTPVTFRMVNGLSTGTLHVWKSNQNEQFIQQPDIVPLNGSFTLTIAAGSIYSITTTTGQAKGTAVPAPAAAFPFPYADDFEAYPVSAQAKYFSDLNGSFEVVECAGGRTGQCLRQAAPAPPIPWTTIGPIEPSSLMGSPNWDNYQISADVFFEQPGTVKLMGRIGGMNVNNGEMYAYELYLDQLGNWSLRQGNFVSLAYGTAAFAGSAWHSAKMVFDGGTVRIVIDGVTVADRATNGVYGRGMAGLGMQGWTTAQFDNFRIDALPGAGLPIPQSQFSVTATGEASGYEAIKAVDGDRRTFWTSPFTCVGGCHPTQPLPQSLTLALGGTYRVQRLRYAPRQDNNQSGAITAYNIYVSTDGTSFTRVTSGNWAPDATDKSASFTPVPASYVRLEAVSAVGGMAAASEVNVDYDPGEGSASAPSIGSLSPSSAKAGDAAIVLSVSGSNFNSGSVIRWNDVDLTTTFLHSGLINTTIPAAYLTSAGTAIVRVFNPAPGGGVSGGQTFTIQPPGTTVPPPVGTPFVTGYAAGPLRNDFTGWVGMRLTVGAAPLTVTSIGRICVSGNAGTHQVKFVSAANGADIPGGSVALSLSGCTAGQFSYASLLVPINLPAGTTYYLVSRETQGGDRWYDQGAITPANAAIVNSAVYSTNGTAWSPMNSTNTSYVPPNFLYFSTPPPPPTPVSVTLQTNPAGLQYSVDGTTYSSTQTFTWASGSSHTIAAASQDTGVGQRYRWSNWSDDAGASHTVSPSSATAYTATFVQQYLLTTTAAPAGSGSIAASPSSPSGYYDAGSSVQLTAVTGSGSTFVNWSGDLSGSTSPANLAMSLPRSVSANFEVSSGGSGLTDFLSSFAPGGRSVRNDFGGWVGMRLTIGANSLNVATLGRICLAGNSGTHPIKLVSATGGDVASVSVNMAGCLAGQFRYATLSAPVTLPVGGTYYLVSQEFQGGDQWYDAGSVSPSSAAAVNGTIYSSGASWVGNGASNTSYVPTSFQYTALPPDPSAPFVNGFSSNSLRNNFTGWVGMKLIVGAAPTTVTSVGRICVAGNSGSHIVKLVDAVTGSDVSGGSAAISMPGCVAGQFAYTTLSAPLTLPPGKTYYLVSQESTGGDRWYDLGGVTTSTIATIQSGVYSSGSAWMSIGGGNNSYGPVNFK